jgi:3-oxoacyl-[acyl-carrier protein] reductase
LFSITWTYHFLSNHHPEEEALKDLAKDIPLGRVGEPGELGALVTFLASQQAAYITGTTIQVDGGLIQSLF